MSLLDANRNPIESVAVDVEISAPEVCQDADTSEESAFLSAMRDIGSYDDDVTLSDFDVFESNGVDFPVDFVDPDDH